MSRMPSETFTPSVPRILNINTKVVGIAGLAFLQEGVVQPPAGGHVL